MPSLGDQDEVWNQLDVLWSQCSIGGVVVWSKSANQGLSALFGHTLSQSRVNCAIALWIERRREINVPTTADMPEYSDQGPRYEIRMSIRRTPVYLYFYMLDGQSPTIHVAQFKRDERAATR